MTRKIRIAVAAIVAVGSLGAFASPALAHPPNPCAACPTAQQ